MSVFSPHPSPPPLSLYPREDMSADPRERGRKRKKERGLGRERERKTLMWEKHRLVALCMCTDWGSNPQPTYVPWWGMESATFWCTGWRPNLLRHPARAVNHSLVVFSPSGLTKLSLYQFTRKHFFQLEVAKFFSQKHIPSCSVTTSTWLGVYVSYSLKTIVGVQKCHITRCDPFLVSAGQRALFMEQSSCSVCQFL